MTQTLEGIILRRTPLKETSLICTAYTKEIGLVSFVARSREARSMLQLSAHVELVMTPPRTGELWRLKDLSLINAFLGLRTHLARIRTMGLCISAILKSQLPSKPSPDLFETLRRHLLQVANANNHSHIGMQFLTKLLKHEGLLEVPLKCDECSSPLQESFISKTSVHCSICQELGAIHLTENEYTLLRALFERRSLTHLEMPSSLLKKIKEIFTQKVEK